MTNIPNYIPNHITKTNLKNKVIKACANGDLPRLQELMTYITTVDKTLEDNTVVTEYARVACKNNHINIIEWFLDNKYGINTIDAIYQACRLNHINIINLIINKTSKHTMTKSDNFKNGVG